MMFTFFRRPRGVATSTPRVPSCFYLGLLAMVATATRAAGSPLLDNGSFERHERGGALHWNLPREAALADQWSLDSDESVEGRWSLRIDRESPQRRGFLVQEIEAKPGETYTLTGFVKGSRLRGQGGDDVGAGVFVEFFDDGEYLRGQYPGTKSGTLDWMLVEHGFTVPDAADQVNVGVYLRPDTVGTAWFDNLHVQPLRGELVEEGDFERWSRQGPTGWVASRGGGVERSSMPWTGDAAAALAAESTLSQQLRLRGDQWYLATLRVRRGTTGESEVALRLRVSDDGAAERQLDVGLPVDSGWERRRVMWRSGAGDNTATLELNAKGNVAVIDSVSVREVRGPIITAGVSRGPAPRLLVDLPYGLSGSVAFDPSIHFTADQPRPIVIPVGDQHAEAEEATRLRIEIGNDTFERRLLRSVKGHRGLLADAAEVPAWARPNRPLGIYTAELQRSDLDRLARAGFTHVLPYAYGVQPSTAPERFLADAQATNLGVIYSLKDLLPASNWFPETTTDYDTLVDRWLERVGDHPAVGALYTADEPKPAHFAQLQRLNDRVADHPPAKPIYTVVSAPQLGATKLEQQKHLRRLAEMSDVIGVDPYPVPRKPLVYAIDEIRLAVESVVGDTPVWAVTQLHAWGVYGHRDEQGRYLREPTFEEKRLMALAAIATGADGLVLYAYQDLFKTGGGGRAESEPINRRLDELDRLGTELASVMTSLRAHGHDATSNRAAPGIAHHAACPVRVIEVDSTRLRVLFANLDDASHEALIVASDSGWRMIDDPDRPWRVESRNTPNGLRLTFPPHTAGVLAIERRDR